MAVKQFLQSLFSSKSCAVCAEKDRGRVVEFEQHCAQVQSLKEQIEDLKQERDLMQAKLFQALRLTSSQAPKEAPQTEVKKTTNARSWPRLKQALELASVNRKADDEKEKMWLEHNARVEREVPELAEKLAASTTQQEIQRDADFLAS